MYVKKSYKHIQFHHFTNKNEFTINIKNPKYNLANLYLY